VVDTPMYDSETTPAFRGTVSTFLSEPGSGRESGTRNALAHSIMKFVRSVLLLDLTKPNTTHNQQRKNQFEANLLDIYISYLTHTSFTQPLEYVVPIHGVQGDDQQKYW
jgi:hypothetical protein